MANNQKRTTLNEAVSKTDARTDARTEARLAISLRCCFVSRKKLPRKAMLRFVYDEDGRLCLDLSEKLPGRGTWLALDRDSLFIGVRRLLAREKAPRKVEDFLQNSARFLEQRCLSYLSLSRRAGLVVSGASACLNCARENRLHALICTQEASLSERRKILRVQRSDRRGCREELDEIPSFACFSADDLGQVFAREQVIYVGLCEQRGGQVSGESYGLVRRTLEELRRFANFSVLLASMRKSNGVDPMIVKSGAEIISTNVLPNGAMSNHRQVDEESNHVGR